MHNNNDWLKAIERRNAFRLKLTLIFRFTKCMEMPRQIVKFTFSFDFAWCCWYNCCTTIHEQSSSSMRVVVLTHCISICSSHDICLLPSFLSLSLSSFSIHLLLYHSNSVEWRKKPPKMKSEKKILHSEYNMQNLQAIKGIHGRRFPRGTSPLFRYNVEYLQRNECCDTAVICPLPLPWIERVFQLDFSIFNALLFDCLIILMKNGDFVETRQQDERSPDTYTCTLTGTNFGIRMTQWKRVRYYVQRWLCACDLIRARHEADEVWLVVPRIHMHCWRYTFCLYQRRWYSSTTISND